MTSVLKVDNIQNSSGGFVIPPAGGIIQVQYTQVTTMTETAAFPSAYYAGLDVTPLNVSITPVSTSSKIKIDVSCMGEFTTFLPHNTMFWLKRTVGSTTTNLRAPSGQANNALGIAAATTTYHNNADSTPEHLSFVYFDEPNTTSAVTYQLTMSNGSTSGHRWRINQNSNTSGTGDYERGISCISATEIAG